MLYSIENREIFKNLNKLISLQSQVKALGIQDKLGKQNLLEDMKKVFESVTKTILNTSEDVTKTVTETSIVNKKALTNVNDKHLEIMNDRGIIATYLLPPLSKITNRERTSEFKLVKDPN